MFIYMNILHKHEHHPPGRISTSSWGIPCRQKKLRHEAQFSAMHSQRLRIRAAQRLFNLGDALTQRDKRLFAFFGKAGRDKGNVERS